MTIFFSQKYYCWKTAIAHERYLNYTATSQFLQMRNISAIPNYAKIPNEGNSDFVIENQLDFWARCIFVGLSEKYVWQLL